MLPVVRQTDMYNNESGATMESWVATRTDEQATLFLAGRSAPAEPGRHEPARSPRRVRGRRRPLLALLAIVVVVAVAQLAAAL